MGTTLSGKKIKDTYQSLVKVTDNTEAGSTGKQLSDGNGNDLGLFIDTDGVLGIGASASYSLDISSKNDALALPSGTTANRPSGQAGLIRYNTTLSKLEYYDSSFEQVASESYVNTQVTNLIDSAPGTLDTLNELAAALNDDASFHTTVTNLINAKQDTITGAATTITSSDLTASKALVSNSSGKVAVSSVTDTELGHLSGVSSAIQTQIDAKQDTISAGTGITLSGATVSADLSNLVDTGAIQSDAVTAPKIAQFDDNLTAAVAGTIMVSDGTDFTDVAVSGDITINSSGVTTIGNDKIDSQHYVDGSIDTAHLSADAVDSTKIADDSINSEHFVDASIDEVHLNVTNTPVDNYLLSFDNASGGFTWVESSGGGSTSFIVETFSGNDSTTAFTLSNTIANENNLQIYIDGVYQSKGNYSTSGTTLTFSTAPPTGSSNIEITHAVAIGGTPSIEIDNFSGNNSTTAFTLSTEPISKNNLQIYIDGVYQSKSNYSTSGTTLTFTTAPETGTNNIEVTHIKLS